MIKDVIKEIEETIQCARFADKTYTEIDVKTLERALFYLHSAKSDIDKVLGQVEKSTIIHANMTQIFKYPLEFTDLQTVQLCGDPLSAIMQHNRLVVYAPFVKNAPMKKYLFRIAGTGHPIEGFDEYTFLETVCPDGNLMFHIFYKEVE